MPNKSILQKRFDDRNKGSARIQALDFKGEEVNFWKPKPGKNYLNFLYYKIATNNHPLVRSNDAKVGDEDFVLDIWVHQYVGPSNCDIICPRRTFGKPCPICEAGQKYHDEGDNDGAQKCRPTHKAIYNVVDEKDRDKGVQIFIASYKYFQQELMDEAGDAGEDGGIIDFPDFKDGKVVIFRAEEESFNRNKYFVYKSFKFKDRDEPLSKSLKDQVYQLDKYMVLHSYDEIRALFYGEDESEDEAADEVEVEDEDELASKSKPKVTERVTKVIEEDEDEEEDDEDEEDDEKVEKEVSKAPKHDEVRSKPKYEDDEDEEDEQSSKKTNKCPFGHTFGKDWDKTDDCEDCDLWGECGKASKLKK